MLDQFDKITEACATISARWPHKPAVGLILGSGLGAAAAALTDTVTIPYESIPHFAKSTAHGHTGQLVCGLLAAFIQKGIEQTPVPKRRGQQLVTHKMLAILTHLFARHHYLVSNRRLLLGQSKTTH